MNKTRLFATATAIVATAAVVWAACYFGAAPVPASADESQEATDNCDGCQTLKIVVSDDPQEQQIQFERFEQEQGARNAEIANEARKTAFKWKGCKFVPSANDSAEYSRQKEAADLLSGDTTVPESRTAFFGAYLSHEGMRHVGWEGTIAQTTNMQDGVMVELRVRPSLVTDNGLAAFVPRWMRETWRIDNAGHVSFDKAEAGGGVGGIIVD